MTSRFRPFFGSSLNEKKFFGENSAQNADKQRRKTTRRATLKSFLKPLPSAFPRPEDELYPEDDVPSFSARERKERFELIKDYNRHRVFWVSNPDYDYFESNEAVETLANGKFRRTKTAALRSHVEWSRRMGLIGRYYTRTSQQKNVPHSEVFGSRAEEAIRLNKTLFRNWTTDKIEAKLRKVEKAADKALRAKKAREASATKRGLISRLFGVPKKSEAKPVAPPSPRPSNDEARRFQRIIEIYAELYQIPESEVLKR